MNKVQWRKLMRIAFKDLILTHLFLFFCTPTQAFLSLLSLYLPFDCVSVSVLLHLIPIRYRWSCNRKMTRILSSHTGLSVYKSLLAEFDSRLVQPWSEWSANLTKSTPLFPLNICCVVLLFCTQPIHPLPSSSLRSWTGFFTILPFRPVLAMSLHMNMTKMSKMSNNDLNAVTRQF